MKEQTIPTDPKSTAHIPPEASPTEDQRIDAVAEEIMARYKPAFEELAK